MNELAAKLQKKGENQAISLKNMYFCKQNAKPTACSYDLYTQRSSC